MIEGDSKEGEIIEEGERGERPESAEVKDTEKKEPKHECLSTYEILRVLEMMEDHEPGPAAGAGGAPVYRNIGDRFECCRALKEPQKDDFDADGEIASW